METRWTVMNGAMKGSVRVMSAAQFTIGRSPECEFVIVNDPKVSRKHVSIVCMNGGCEVICLNEKNPAYINGNEINKGRLNEGDTLTLGDTELQLNFGGPVQLEVPMMAAVPQAMPPGYNPYAAPVGYQAPPARPRGQARRQAPKGNSKRFLIYGVVALVLYLILSDNGLKKKEAKKMRTEADIQADIEASVKLKEAGEAQATKKDDGTVNARQAQENYVRGFRDYRDGQFERALISFQACLALNPEHTLCNRYLRLSQRRFNQVIQNQMVLGRQYRDQNQFKACRAAFRNVMVMVKDASSQTYKEAKANYEACNTFVEGRF
jgi:hypothetical protein